MAGAIAAYCLLSILLILQKPGLEDDEAFLVAGAVHMRHPAETYNLGQAPDIWICPFHYCVPLMGGGSRYVGAIKDYLALPLFVLFGPRTVLVRLIAMLLGAIGIWGISRLPAWWAGGAAGAAVAMVLAISPAYVDMTVFDNNALAGMMAGVGLTCAALAGYLRRGTTRAAALLGAAIGFGVWTRANFVWIAAAAALAAIVIYREKLLVPVRHWVAIACGGVAGGFPFLLYQAISVGGTWKAQSQFGTSQPFAELLAYRLFMFREVVFSDTEHRSMWGTRALPDWQMWLFPALVAAACVICLIPRSGDAKARRADTQFVALSMALLVLYLVFTRLDLAEHHLMTILPFAATAVVLACVILQSKFRWAWILSAALALVYAGSALYWQAAAIQGLKSTGGLGFWSDGALDLARQLDAQYRGRDIQVLDWGFQSNLYVLTDGRVKFTEIYSPDSENISTRKQSWPDELRDGGLFLLSGVRNRVFPKSIEGFQKAMVETKAMVNKRYTVAERDGVAYADLLEVEPNKGPELFGLYPVEQGGWRWTAREFSIRLPAAKKRDNVLTAELNIPDPIVQKLGPMTLTARVGDHILAPETYAQPGGATYRRALPAEWITGDSVRIDFELDRALEPTPPERRVLGIVVSKIEVTPGK